MKRLKSWYQRYKGMGTLFWVVCIVLFAIVLLLSEIIDLIQAEGEERLQGWAYVCNLLALVVLCVNILRLDCRNLLSHKTLELFVGLDNHPAVRFPVAICRQDRPPCGEAERRTGLNHLIPLPMPIVVNLDIMMARRKITLGELAEKIDITPANLSILKTGKAKAIRFSTLEAICKVLDCQPGDLLEYREEE